MGSYGQAWSGLATKVGSYGRGADSEDVRNDVPAD